MNLNTEDEMHAKKFWGDHLVLEFNFRVDNVSIIMSYSSGFKGGFSEV